MAQNKQDKKNNKNQQNTQSKNAKKIDELTGVEINEHSWDGIQELNRPCPRWWVLTWIACIIFSIGYAIYYPTIQGIQGSSGWTSHKELVESQNEIFARKEKYLKQFEGVSLEEISNNPELSAFAKAGGVASFKDNCAMCHGSGAAGFKGYPNLNDDDWLWGGSLNEIYDTIKYGIRSGHDEMRDSAMPAFGRDELLTSQEIQQVTDYVLSLSGKADSSVEGAVIFEENCASCHGENGEGVRDFGAPKLSDAIWLYGSTRDDVVETVTNSRNGVMPAWVDRLDDNTIKQLAIYIHSLGGGE